MKKLALAIAVLALFVDPAFAADSAKEPIRIGEISEFNLFKVYADNQHNAFELAVDDLNANGGVLGHPLKLITRQGGSGTPEEVLRDVEDLVHRENVKLLIGTGPDHTGLAVSSYARKNGIFYLKGANGTNKHIWQEGHDLAFRFDVSNYVYGKAFAQAAAKLPAKRWAIIAPDYEFGHSVVEDFTSNLKKLRPDVTFTPIQWHPMLKIQSGPVVQVLKQQKPDAFFIASFASDAVQLIRDGKKIGLYKDKPVISVLQGQPESLAPLGKEAPMGWITQGYPADQIDAPAHKAFLAKYRAKYNAEPGWFSFVGYNAMISLAKAIETAGSTEPKAVAAAMKGMTFDSLVGPITYRAADNQSNLGLWVGKIGM